MRNFKKRTIALCLASAITVLGSFASDTYDNSIVSLSIDSGSKGNVSFTAYTKKPYSQTLRTEQVDKNTYYVIIPGAKSEISVMPNISQFDNIESMQVSTFPYAPGIEGYTRITVKTVGEPTVSAVTSLAIEDKTKEAKPYNELSTEPKKQETVVIPEKKSTSYWDQHSNTQPATEQASAIPQKQTYKQESTTRDSQQDFSNNEFNINYDDISMDNPVEKRSIILWFFILTALIIGIVFLKKDKMTTIVGDQKDLDFGDNANNKKSQSKSKKIRGTINKLDSTYTNQPSVGKVNIVTGAAIDTAPDIDHTFKDEVEEEAVVVDLDSLYNEKTRSETNDAGEADLEKEDNGEDDLAEFLTQFSFEEETPEPEETFDEEFYTSIINGKKYRFSKADLQKLSQLLQNEISDETLDNIEEFAPKMPEQKKIPTEMDILENVLAEYTIKQNISFSKDDVDIIRKLINVELDDTFITNLRTNPQRTEAMKKEIENREKKPHKTSEMRILNVKGMLPDLSLEVKKQGNRAIQSEVKPEVVYYSEGYDYKKMSVSSELANMSKAMMDKDANKFRPSDESPIVESGYEVKTLAIKDALPDITDYKKNPSKYEEVKVKEEIDEKALLESIMNVKFKPFYEDVQEELSQFEGFEVIDEDKEEEIANEQMFKELENFNKQTQKQEKPEKTDKIDSDAQRLLELIEEQKAKRRNKALVINKENTKDVNKVAETLEKVMDDQGSSELEIEGNLYNIIKTVKCSDDMNCLLTKNENGYTVIGQKQGKYIILKQYDELRTENIQTRVNEKNPDGTVQYLIRVSIHKFIVNATKNNMEFLMDLC